MIEVDVEVRVALEERRAVVALESTIIAHGLPEPDNLLVARAMERAVRDSGAVPATIAVIDGVPRVGLSADELARVAAERDRFAKVGISELAAACAASGCAATTVSATASLAARVGIRMFATGGIGGVHRGDAADVSSDLWALAREPVGVVCAGPKAILDIERTAEALESLGVQVVGYGTDEMPAFYSRRSGVALRARVDSAKQAAAVVRSRIELGLGGALIVNPIRAEAEIPSHELAPIIDAACDEARQAGVIGAELTPFLLRRLAEVTAGRSIAANRVLAEDNAALAAAIAVAMV